MPIRLIAMDLDKTLLHSDKSLSAFSAQTLCACRNASPTTAAAAAYHCESNDDDGVARWLRRALPHLFTTL